MRTQSTKADYIFEWQLITAIGEAAIKKSKNGQDPTDILNEGTEFLNSLNKIISLLKQRCNSKDSAKNAEIKKAFKESSKKHEVLRHRLAEKYLIRIYGKIILT